MSKTVNKINYYYDGNMLIYSEVLYSDGYNVRREWGLRNDEFWGRFDRDGFVDKYMDELVNSPTMQHPPFDSYQILDEQKDTV